MVISSVLDAILAVTTIILRCTAVLFTRFHPLGRRYLNQIYGNGVTYFICLLAKILTNKSQAASKRRRSGLVLLFGWFDPRQPLASFITVFLNLLSLGAVWDFLYRSHIFHQSNELSFSRVGYVDETSARIVVRAPAEPATYVEIRLSSAEESVDQVEPQTIAVTESGDYVGTFVLEGLRPNTKYSYSTNVSHTGSFKTADQSQKRWGLVSTSCIKPFYPYSPLDHGLGIRGLEYLDQYISVNPVDMMLFLGDFIYIDLPVALGWTPDHYTSAYRQVYASPSWTPALRSLPWLHAYDDHEIINDWAANETGLYQSAMQPFWAYHGHANPASQFGQGKTHYIFRRGDISFFVMDTRRYRSAESTEDGPGKTMLGSAQLADLQQWLASEKAWKVVVSSVPFTRNWRGPDSADSWSGYLWEREQVLDMMRRTDGVVILSGDRHEHATTIFPPGRKGGKSIIEFSTSPLNQFYEPFSRFHEQIEDTDVSVHSHPWGNSKFGVVFFDTSRQDRLQVDFDLVVDGEKTWNYTWTYER
ncbi:alkaline phosphatase family protein [Colletotrichum truncatum]|uniref:Alkaline phosphatase family protein n=1 Tax=Colletotrichum truncatum TaxID=5467 RepID=A0ACC3Z6Y4_COLTU|nr:alkaline phosphatase family protein [Colletotrichum truncatum]KAF6781292.1 alkaline phosphatase family protein [Colletotrichum truncatum]